MRTGSFPDFFILGAPKCGTSALYNYLKSHPDVYLPPKELHFFASDLGLGRRIDQNKYFNFYREAAEPTAKGEAATWYMLSETAVPAILQINAEAKFIVMVRNPIAMATSLHRQNINNGQENEFDFARAWNLQSTREQGMMLPPGGDQPWALQYSKVCSLGSQLSWVLTQAPRKQLHIVVFDDFINNTAHEYAKVLDFLQLTRCKLDGFPIVNRAYKMRFPALTHFIKRPPPRTQRLLNNIDAVSGLKTEKILRKLGKVDKKINKIRNQVAPPSAELQKEMRNTFAPDVGRLSSILERDLESEWLG